jgi:hypothetical protein
MLFRLGLVGPLLAVRLQMALHPDAERAAAHFAASEAANDGRRLVTAGEPVAAGGGAGGVGGRGGGGYYAGPPPPIQDNPMLDILQVSGRCVLVWDLGVGWFLTLVPPVWACFNAPSPTTGRA